jgi:outer membrane protein OmpA-like peptidoglycan-associated protein
LNSEKSELRNQLEQSNSKFKSLQKSFNKAKLGLGMARSDLSNLENQHKESLNKIKSLENEKVSAIVKSTSFEEKVYREPASVRSRLAENIHKRFKDLNVNVTTNRETGAITLTLDEAFLFVNDSYVLRNEVKEKLKMIIPVYTEELFKNEWLQENITSINVTGHASPRFRGQPVKLEDNNIEAYTHNLLLSSQRAVQIVNHVVSSDFGKFKYKTLFRKKVSATGKSYSQPIELDKSKPGLEVGKCGDFDCRRSRRVEISFSLAENKRNIVKNLKMNNRGD